MLLSLMLLSLMLLSLMLLMLMLLMLMPLMLMPLMLMPLMLMPLATSGQAAPANQPAPLANAVILIIRPAEKPDTGTGLTPMGQKWAVAYIRYARR